MKSLFKETKILGLAAIALASLGSSAALMAAEDGLDEVLKPDRAVIRFADLGGIKNWRADGDDAIEIWGRNGDWYRAEFWSFCQGLRSAQDIGFITEPNGDLNRFSSIYVGRGERCQFKSFKKIEMPTGDQDGE